MPVRPCFKAEMSGSFHSGTILTLMGHAHPDDQATGNRQVGTTHGIHCLIGHSPGSVNTYIWICQQSIPAAGQPAAEQPLCPEGLRPRVEACQAKW